MTEDRGSVVFSDSKIEREPSFDRKKRDTELKTKRTSTTFQDENQEIPALRYKAGYRRVQFSKMPTEYQFNYRKPDPSPLLQAAIKKTTTAHKSSHKENHGSAMSKDKGIQTNEKQTNEKQMKDMTNLIDHKAKNKGKVTVATIHNPTPEPHPPSPPHPVVGPNPIVGTSHVTPSDNHSPVDTTSNPNNPIQNKPCKRSPTFPFVTEYQANFNPEYWTKEQKISLINQQQILFSERKEDDQMKDIIYGPCYSSHSMPPHQPPISSTTTTTRKSRTVKTHSGTEYSSNYLSPTRLKYTRGAWEDAPQPNFFPSKHPSSDYSQLPKCEVDSLSSWYSQVLELRDKAKQYKERGQGTYREFLDKIHQQSSSSCVSPSASQSHDDHVIREPMTVADIECYNNDIDDDSNRSPDRPDSDIPIENMKKLPVIDRSPVTPSTSSHVLPSPPLLKQSLKNASGTQGPPVTGGAGNKGPVLVYEKKNKPVKQVQTSSRPTYIPRTYHHPSHPPSALSPPPVVKTRPDDHTYPTHPSTCHLCGCAKTPPPPPKSCQSCDRANSPIIPATNLYPPLMMSSQCATCKYNVPAATPLPLRPVKPSTSPATVPMSCGVCQSPINQLINPPIPPWTSADCDLCKSAVDQFTSRNPTPIKYGQATPISATPIRATPTQAMPSQTKRLLSHHEWLKSRPQEDNMSISSISSSCSIASELYNKAQQRKDFWSKTAKE
jgi:hypothetical protein